MSTDLDHLDSIAANADGMAADLDPKPEGAEEVAQQGPDYATEARGTVDMITAMITGYAPKTEAVWTTAAKDRVAAALAPVLEKYNFSFGAMPCELTLAIVAGPLLWQSSRIIATQMAQDKADNDKTVTAKRPVVTAETQVQAAQAPQPPLAPDSPDHAAPKSEMHPQMALYKK